MDLPTIRTITLADLATADRIMQSAFGTPDRRQEELGRYLNLQPGGWFLAESEGRSAGLVGAFDYGPFAWIGFMAVLPELQKRGIGRALMGQVLSWLEGRGSPMARLDASAAGAPLYRKLGFEAVSQALQFVRQDASPVIPTPVEVFACGPGDIPDVAELDETIFGAVREPLLKSLLAGSPGGAFLTRSGAGEVSGYLFARSQKIGPWAANSPDAALALLARAQSLPFQGSPRVIVPSENVAAVELLTESGFLHKQTHLHMRRGGAGLPGQRQLLYGQASYAVG